MNSRLTYNCCMKEWELLKRFYSQPIPHIGAWYLIHTYYSKTSVPNCKTIKTIETGTYRLHCVFRVNCSDSLIELIYVRDWFLSIVHFLISLLLIGLSCIGIFSFTFAGLLGGSLSVLFVFC